MSPRWLYLKPMPDCMSRYHAAYSHNYNLAKRRTGEWPSMCTAALRKECEDSRQEIHFIQRKYRCSRCHEAAYMRRARNIMVTPLLLWLLLNKCERWCNVIYYALKFKNVALAVYKSHIYTPKWILYICIVGGMWCNFMQSAYMHLKLSV